MRSNILSKIARYQAVSEILSKHDPMDLCTIGSPKDEYEHEAIELVNHLSGSEIAASQAIWHLTNSLYGIFVLSFDRSIIPQDPKVWENIAKDLYPCFHWRGRKT